MTATPRRISQMDTAAAALADYLVGLDVSDTAESAEGSTRAFNIPYLLGLAGHRVEGRLTLTSGTAVTTSDVTGAGTLYFTPYKGNVITLYDGSAWRPYSFTEESLAVSVSSGGLKDVFAYYDSGVQLEFSSAWTNATTRADALALQDGRLVKDGDPTRLYLGTIGGSGSNTVEDSAAKRLLWNNYNRLPRVIRKYETTADWTYATNTWRAWNNSSSNRIEVVRGLNEDPVSLGFNWLVSGAAVGFAAIGLDSTTVPTGLIGSFSGSGAGGLTVIFNRTIGIGHHYLQALENTNGGGTMTFYGISAGNIQEGMEGYVCA